MSLADSLDILFEDNHCLVLNKPAGWPTTHFEGREETVDRLAKAYLKEKYAKPGQVFLGVVHRLDKPVSGVLLFARTSKAAARLSEQFREGVVEKTYWAIVESSRPTGKSPPPWARLDTGAIEDWLKRMMQRRGWRLCRRTLQDRDLPASCIPFAGGTMA